MTPVTIEQIDEQLRQLPPDKLAAVLKFVNDLRERLASAQAALASEEVLRRDWDRPEEDAAWAHLNQVIPSAEDDMSDYRTQLEDYEERLARGEIRW